MEWVENGKVGTARIDVAAKQVAVRVGHTSIGTAGTASLRHH